MMIEIHFHNEYIYTHLILNAYLIQIYDLNIHYKNQVTFA